MANKKTVTLTLAAAADNKYALSQTPIAAGDLTLTATLTADVARRVLITSSGADTGKTFTVYGTNRNGVAISEAIAGPGTGTVTTNLDFKTITRVSVSAATAGAIKVGTSGAASSEWVQVGVNVPIINIGVEVLVSSGATLNYDVEYTYNPNAYKEDDSTVYIANHATLVNKTSSADSLISAPVASFRLTLNTFSSGTLTMRSIQAGQGAFN